MLGLTPETRRPVLVRQDRRKDVRDQGQLPLPLCGANEPGFCRRQERTPQRCHGKDPHLAKREHERQTLDILHLLGRTAVIP